MSVGVVQFSGGAGSAVAAKRVADGRHERLVLLFADTLIEDHDLYRFLPEAAAWIGGEFVRIADGRTPWEVFGDERILSARYDPCSKKLKRELLDRWLRENCDPADTTVYVGVGWSEMHRYERLRDRRAVEGWHYEAPLCDPPYLSTTDVMAELRNAGIRPPRLYDMGFAHNNCGGFCIKAGQAHFALLLRKLPERFAFHEQKEQEIRAKIGDGAYILRDRTGGNTKPLTLRDFRLRLEAGEQFDAFDIGGCGCAIDEATKSAPAGAEDETL